MNEREELKPNGYYLAELQENNGCIKDLHDTPYSGLSILFDSVEEKSEYSYSSKTIIKRKALIRNCNGVYSFLVDNWFDDIDNFESGLYAKVKLGNFYNLIKPSGEYLFPYWHGNIEFQANIIFCSPVQDPKPSTSRSIESLSTNKVGTLYDMHGKFILENVTIKTEFINGFAIISRGDRFNYLTTDGKILCNEWLINAQEFCNNSGFLYAFAKTSDGWGIIDANGDFAISARFSMIWKTESILKHSCGAVAIVAITDGMNIIVQISNNSQVSLSLRIGFQNNAESIVSLGVGNDILVKYSGKWYIYNWDGNRMQFNKTVELGDLDVLESIQISGKFYKIIKKGELYNVIDTKGVVFNEWFNEIRPCSGSFWIVKKDELYNIIDTEGVVFNEWFNEIQCYGNLFKVKRLKEAPKEDIDIYMNTKTPGYEFNLIAPHGPYILKEWVNNMTVTPFDGAFLVNIKPKLNNGFNLGPRDESITYERVQVTEDSWIDRIKKIEGLCNIITEGLLFETWHDSFEFFNREIFTNGYLKVWNTTTNKCNLINKAGEYVSKEWVDDFVMSRFFTDSYHTDLKENAFLVKKDNKINLLFNGHFMLKQWFSKIEHYYDDSLSNKEVYSVWDGNLKGIYYLETGLVGKRLYEQITRISEELYFCRFDNEGHIMTLDGEIITAAPIKDVETFKDGYAAVLTDKQGPYNKFKYNFINSEGELVSQDWFDGDFKTRFYNSEDEQQGFYKVCKESKFNILTKDKKLLFKKWYDSIDGAEGKWLISDNSRGEYKFNFINNNENILSSKWYNMAYPLYNVEEGIYAVYNENGGNIFDHENKIVLPEWTKKWIHRGGATELAFIATRNYGSTNCADAAICDYLRRDGHLISHYHATIESAKAINYKVLDQTKRLIIIELRSEDEGRMKMLCKVDGTPFFASAQNPDNDKSSIFGSIRLIDKESKLLVEPDWPTYRWQKTKKFIVMDFEGHKSESFEHVSDYNDEGFAVVRKCGRFNLLDRDFHLISPLWFSDIGYKYKSNETIYTERMNYDTGWPEFDSRNVTKTRRDVNFHDGYLQVKLGNSYNMIDRTWKFVFPVWYESLSALPFGFFKVKLDNLYNIIDKYNKAISDVWFDDMKIFRKDNEQIVYKCESNGKYKLLFLNESDFILSDIWGDKIFNYSKEGYYYPVQLGEKMNIITTRGNLLLPQWYDDIRIFYYRDTYIVVQENNSYNIYSPHLSKIIGKQGFQEVVVNDELLFSYGWCGVKVDGKYTFVNTDGELAAGRFDSIMKFNNGFAGIVLNGKRNFLTSKGTLLSDIWFDKISDFNSFGKAIVVLDDKYNIIDNIGRLLLPDDIQPFSNIGMLKRDYCSLSCATGDGTHRQIFYDFQTKNLHNTEYEVLDYLKELTQNKACSKEKGSASEHIDATCNDMRLFDDIIEGVQYTLITFGNKANFVDKDRILVFADWIDKSSVQMHQGVAFIKNGNDNWINIK